MRDFKDLIVWQKSHKLSVAIFKITLNFPKEETYGMMSQIRRACFSIAANIAEGCGRDTNLEFARFLRISYGSANELEYYLLLSHDVGIITTADYNKLLLELVEIKKMLTTFIQKLKKSN